MTWIREFVTKLLAMRVSTGVAMLVMGVGEWGQPAEVFRCSRDFRRTVLLALGIFGVVIVLWVCWF